MRKLVCIIAALLLTVSLSCSKKKAGSTAEDSKESSPGKPRLLTLGGDTTKLPRAVVIEPVSIRPFVDPFNKPFPGSTPTTKTLIVSGRYRLPEGMTGSDIVLAHIEKPMEKNGPPALAHGNFPLPTQNADGSYSYAIQVTFMPITMPAGTYEVVVYSPRLLIDSTTYSLSH